MAQTARALGLDVRTVARWAEVEQFRARRAAACASKLDVFKGQIVRWLHAHPYSAQQVYQWLAGEEGYQLWFSLAQPLPAARALAFGDALRANGEEASGRDHPVRP